MAHGINGNNENIIRKMTLFETYFGNGHSIGRDHISRLFILESKFDIFKHKSDLFKAISLWMQIHPLLRSKIRIDDVYDEKNKEYLKEGYFLYASEDKIKSLENVKLLRFKSNKIVDAQQYLNLLFEHELLTSVDILNGLLWRLKIIEINANIETNSYKYGFILTPTHAITDGKNFITIILELLELIEHVHSTKLNKLDENKAFIAVQEADFINDPRNVGKNENFFCESNVVGEALKIPDFLKPQSIKSNQLYYNSFENLVDGFFETDDGQVYAKVEDLVEQSKNDKSLCGYHFMSFKDDKFKLLAKKCKERSIKLNGCFEVIVALALQKTYKHFSNNLYNLDVFKYAVNINLRNHFNPPVDFSIMGVWTTGFDGKLVLNDDTDSDEFWRNTFWKLAKEQSDCLHQFLDSKYFITEEALKTFHDHIYSLIKGNRVKDVTWNFMITNLGQVPSKTANSLGLIELKESYSLYSYLEDDSGWPLFSMVISIDNNLFWTTAYSRHLFKSEVVNYYVRALEELFNRVSYS